MFAIVYNTDTFGTRFLFSLDLVGIGQLNSTIFPVDLFRKQWAIDTPSVEIRDFAVWQIPCELPAGSHATCQISNWWH